jgi:hypothetical protein
MSRMRSASIYFGGIGTNALTLREKDDREGIGQERQNGQESQESYCPGKVQGTS